METGWTSGEIRRPKKDWLTIDEFAGLFEVTDDYIQEQVDAGILPEPVRHNRKLIRFSWRVAVYYDQRLTLFPPSKPEPVKDKTKTG